MTVQTSSALQPVACKLQKRRMHGPICKVKTTPKRTDREFSQCEIKICQTPDPYVESKVCQGARVYRWSAQDGAVRAYI
jgi:hypothetical protein